MNPKTTTRTSLGLPPLSLARPVHGTRLEETVRSAAREMERTHVGFLVVLDEGGDLAGVVTDRDVTVRVLALGLDPDVVKVKEIMTEEVHTLQSGSDVAEAAHTMRSHRVRRLPIVDTMGRPIGVISMDDLLTVVGRNVADLTQAVRRELENEARPPQQALGSLYGKE